LDFGVIWEKYEQGKTIIAQEEAKKQREQAEANQEMKIFGMKLSDYLKQRGVKPGPAMGQAVRLIREIINNNQGEPEDKIKEIIDGISL